MILPTCLFLLEISLSEDTGGNLLHSQTWDWLHNNASGLKSALYSKWFVLDSFLQQIFFFFYGCTLGTWKFPGQRLNLSHNCDLYYSCSNAGSFNPLHRAGDWTYTSTATQATAVRFLIHCGRARTPSCSRFCKRKVPWVTRRNIILMSGG